MSRDLGGRILVVSDNPGLTLAEFLDDMPLPVTVFDSQERVIAVNQAMADRHNRPDRDASGMLSGDVEECVYARRAGGCGEQLCCQACTLRLTIHEVARSGGVVHRRPAYIDRDEGREAILVSARADGDAVIIVVESVSGVSEE